MANREYHVPTLPVAEPSTQEERPPAVPIKKRARPRVHASWYLYTAACWILLALGLILLVQQVVQVSQMPSDFCQDYIAAQRLAQGTPIYLPLNSPANCPQGVGAYDTHPPPSALLVFPLGFLSYPAASLLWGCCLLAAYLASGILLLRALGWFSLRGVALFVIGSIYWQPLMGAEGDQNLWQFLLLLLVIAWVLERRGALAASGYLLGVAWLLKLWPSVLLLGAVTRRRWRQALGAALAIALGTALTLVVLGPETYMSYLGPVRAGEDAWAAYNGNVSLVGVVTRFLAGDGFLLPPVLFGVPLKEAVLLGEAAAGLFALGAAAFVGWCRWQAPNELDELLAEGIFVTITPLIFPLTWFFSFITLLLPFATTILALRQMRRPPRWWFGVVALSLAPLVTPSVCLTLGDWFLQHQSPGAAWFATFAFDLPSIGLFGFACAQGYLLWKGARHAGEPAAKPTNAA